MRTKRLIKGLKKLGCSRKQYLMVLRNGRAFKLSNQTIFKQAKLGKKLAKTFTNSISGMVEALKGFTELTGNITNQFVSLAKFLENNLLDTGERAYLYSTGNIFLFIYFIIVFIATIK